MQKKLLPILAVGVLAVALSSMPMARASTGLTVNPYVIASPGGTTTLTLTIDIPAGVTTQLLYWNISEPDGDTCTITVPLIETGPTSVTVSKTYPTDAALAYNSANDGCDTNDVGGTWYVYAAIITNADVWSFFDDFTLSFHVIPESAIGIAAISGAGLATFAGYKVLRTKSRI